MDDNCKCVESSFDDFGCCQSCHKLGTKFVSFDGKETLAPNTPIDAETRNALIEKAIPLNRYDCTALMSLLEQTAISIVAGQGEFSLALNNEDADEIEVLVLLREEVGRNYRSVINEVISRIADFDNLVQASCRAAAMQARDYLTCRTTVIRGYESCQLSIANIIISEVDGPLTVTLKYYGVIVNTEWDANFKLVNGEWYGLEDKVGWQRITVDIDELR